MTAYIKEEKKNQINKTKLGNFFLNIIILSELIMQQRLQTTFIIKV